MRRVPSLLIAFAAFAAVPSVVHAEFTGIYGGGDVEEPTFLQLFEQDGQVSGNVTGAEFGTIAGQLRDDGVAAGTLDMGELGAAPVEIRKNWSGVILTLIGTDGQRNLAFFEQPASVPSVDAAHTYFVLSDIPFGRLSAPEIRRRLEIDMLGPDSHVFVAGMMDWVPISTIPEFADFISEIDAPPIGAPPLVGADDPLRSVLVSTLTEQIAWFTPNQREAVAICALDVLSALDSADHDLLVQTRINLSNEQQADFDARNPGLFDSIYACVDPTIILGERRSSIELLDGRVFSVRGPGAHSIDIAGIDPVFTVGTTSISYADDVLTVDGTPMDVPAFSKSLEVDIAEDGTASLVVDP